MESVLSDLQAQLVQVTSGASVEQIYRPLLELYARLTASTGCTLGAPATAAAERLSEIVVAQVSSPAVSVDEPDMEPAILPEAALPPSRALARGRSSSPRSRLDSGCYGPAPVVEAAKPTELHPQEGLLVELERCRMRLEDRRIPDALDLPSPGSGGHSPPRPSQPAPPERLTSRAEEFPELALAGRSPSPGRCQSVPPQPEATQPPSPRELPPPTALRLGRLSRSTPPCREQLPKKCPGEPQQVFGACSPGVLRRKLGMARATRKSRRSGRLDAVPEAAAMQEAQVLLAEMLRHCGTSSCSRPRAEPPAGRPPRPREHGVCQALGVPGRSGELTAPEKDCPAVPQERAKLKPLNGSMPWFPATEWGNTPAKKASASRQREEDRPATPPTATTTASTGGGARQSLRSDPEDRPATPPTAATTASTSSGAQRSLRSDPEEAESPVTPAWGCEGGADPEAELGRERTDSEFCRLLTSALAEPSL
uniref:Uncharacterized protein n=1 Tax=Alexandrium monilatum TaxID=311494 RepID=A0A7S4RIG9_9DINO